MKIEDVKRKWGISVLHYTPGDNPTTTEEEVAEQIDKALTELIENVDDYEDFVDF